MSPYDKLITARHEGDVWIEKQAGETYFIVQGDKADGLVKVGMTTAFDRRIRAIQSSSPVAVNLLSRTRDVSEQYVHLLFSEDRRHGEWFNQTGALLSLICGNPHTELAASLLNQHRLRGFEVISERRRLDNAVGAFMKSKGWLPWFPLTDEELALDLAGWKWRCKEKATETTSYLLSECLAGMEQNTKEEDTK